MSAAKTMENTMTTPIPLETMDGNTAVTWIAYRVNEVCTIYPITPSSVMAELADTWSAAGQRNLDGDGALMKALHERARFESFKHEWQINFRAKLGLKSHKM